MTEVPPVIFIKDNESYTPMRVKTCTYCGGKKPLTEFNKHRITLDGLDHQCRTCANARTATFRASPSGIYTSLKGRQTYARKHEGKKDRGYHLTIKPVTISREAFVKWYNAQTKECAYCDIPEERLGEIRDKYNNKNLRLSVDCKVNHIGYALGNLVLACSRCNSIKSDFFTHEDVIFIGQNFVKFKWTLGKVKK